ncbi:hypothetical protein HPB50_014174 [Hyalomma asiaticum]|uniref:Uncharacterized protein n=1 Tax=Hyalomma asiaticum TaxID=266040 RepID=A0ACB7SHR2_HYAAI|nr:hypothetical protein HPB50_014174 [Hyalomma asiaticum]
MSSKRGLSRVEIDALLDRSSDSEDDSEAAQKKRVMTMRLCVLTALQRALVQRLPREHRLPERTAQYHPDYTQSVLSSGRCSVSVWGSISKDGLRPLVCIDGKFTAPYYSSLLQDTMLPYACFIFQQDKSPVLR